MGVQLHRGAIAEVTIDFPPVNAVPAAGWQQLADCLGAAAG